MNFKSDIPQTRLIGTWEKGGEYIFTQLQTDVPKFNSQSSDLFQAANVFLCIRLIICIGTGIGLFNCKTTDGEYFCIWWDPEALDSLTNLVSIHDTIAGIWVFVCVYWKILFPLYDFIGIRFEEGFYGGEDKYVHAVVYRPVVFQSTGFNQESRKEWNYTTSVGYADSHT